ncbi:hypothetical protein [Paenibacillus sp.]|uniref:hypothetical protein n=1 Tax=Paenibacillus sp. TaxID=58172 RepID=UPI002D7322C7|nr:hypothetical protein [Paenibacillus sp.]HZG57944.1 hypothetical protein [Paenibacillus sp.]
MRMAKVGVLLPRHAAERRWRLGVNVFERYITEVLDQAGIPFRLLEDSGDLSAGACDIVVALLADETAEDADRLWSYIETGGTAIAFAGLASFRRRLGCVRGAAVGPGYAVAGHPAAGEEPLRFLKADPWTPDASGAYEAESAGVIRQASPHGAAAGPACLTFRIGEGVLHRWAVDIPGAIVGLQQGTAPVLTDGWPAPDGTAPYDDGLLKAEDQCELHWDYDRDTTETGNPYFPFPYADAWRELVAGQLLSAALAKGLTLPFVGAWPDGVDAVGLVSHDSDLNVPESAWTTLDLLAETDIRSCWCMIEPGFGPDVYERVVRDGHELAFHYNALAKDGGEWSQAAFDRQLAAFRATIGDERIVSNKNHYTRFEGWGELWQWCEAQGIELDQTRGPSKRGNVGMPFGTCRPYFPIAWHDERNRYYDVLQLGFLTQDLDIGTWADRSIVAPLLERVRRVEGVAHFLFHQYHLHYRPEARDALRYVVAEAKRRGFAFWTSREINDWERERRSIRIDGVDPDGKPRVRARAVSKPAVAWVPIAEPEPGEALEIKYGVPCRKALIAAAPQD